MAPESFREYWRRTLDELARCPDAPEVEVLPLRSTAFATLYGVRLTSLGPYRLFAYLSIPAGPGPFPAISYAPKYQSVLEIIPQGTANAQRSRYVTFSLRARAAQRRLAVRRFPGLLTDGIDSEARYVFRGIVADSVRGVSYLLARPEVDGRRVVLVGNDVALMTARPTRRGA